MAKTPREEYEDTNKSAAELIADIERAEHVLMQDQEYTARHGDGYTDLQRKSVEQTRVYYESAIQEKRALLRPRLVTE